MRTFFDCYSCFVKQALAVLKYSGATDDHYPQVMRSVFNELAISDFNVSPPEIVQKIYSIIRNTMGNKDPFAEDKMRFNRLASKLLSEIQKESTISFVDKIKFSIAANIIDFGKNTDLCEKDVIDCFEGVKKTQIDEKAVSDFNNALSSAKNIMYLCDNSGEIVFDRFLIEDLPYHKITCAVRGAPVINDATLEDAKYAGLTSLAKTISNGSDAPGTVLQQCSEEFKCAFDRADLIVAKGQGNFETLSEIKDKRIFFLLQVKCPVISSHIGYPVGSSVIKENS